MCLTSVSLLPIGHIVSSFRNFYTLGQQGSLVGKGTVYQDWKIEFDPQGSFGRIKVDFCKVSSYRVHVCAFVHTKFKNRKACTLINTPFCRRRSDFIDVFT